MPRVDVAHRKTMAQIGAQSLAWQQSHYVGFSGHLKPLWRTGNLAKLKKRHGPTFPFISNFEFDKLLKAGTGMEANNWAPADEFVEGMTKLGLLS